MFDLSILRAVRRCLYGCFVISSRSTSLGFAESCTTFPDGRLLRWIAWEWGTCRSAVCRFDRCPLCDHLDLLVFSTSFLAICRVWLLLLGHISSNDTKVPEHEIRNKDLFEQGSSSIRQLDMTQSVDGSFYMYGVTSEIGKAR